MTRYLKLFSSVVLCVFTVGLMGCNDYTPNPEDDIALFQPFIDANINKKSDDPYISSTVRPGDELYSFLVSLQHGDGLSKYLDSLVKEDNADALYWYAMLRLANIKERKENFRLLDRAAEMGLPYAAWALSNQSGDCLMFLGSSSIVSQVSQSLGKDNSFEKKACSEDYLNLSIKLAKEKAEQGDLRSQYFLLKQLTQDGKLVPLITEEQLVNSNYYQLNFSKETRQHYIKEVIRFAENHYYQPLMDYVHTIVTSKGYKSPYKANSPALFALAKDLLTIAANHNYIPAIKLLLIINNENGVEDNKLIEHSIDLGSSYTLYNRYFANDAKGYDGYYYGLFLEQLTGQHRTKDYSPSPTELKEMMNSITERMIAMTPMVYIDGFTSRDEWVD